MNIVMLTNTYKPHVGGVARSVEWFSKEYRDMGHDVLIMAPTYEGAKESTDDVIRIPALQNFNGSDFSVILPIPKLLNKRLVAFNPDIVHSHHPFLMGSTAIRAACQFEIPLVFTHHTMYERYTHYVPADFPKMKRFVIELATGYANMCDRVIAPSESVAAVLKDRGVTTPSACIPTGVYVEKFTHGNGKEFRHTNTIPPEAFVIGHLGRLAPEKNLQFLSKAVSDYLLENRNAHFLVIGDGASRDDIEAIFEKKGLSERLHLPGKLTGQHLVDGYHAMDVFAFASTSETQGMVLTEAMAAGVPVVALDAPGAREVVEDKTNGRLVAREEHYRFTEALGWMAEKLDNQAESFRHNAHQTAEAFSMRRCAERSLELYNDVIEKNNIKRPIDDTVWGKTREQIKTEWDLIKTMTDAAVSAIKESDNHEVESQ